MHYHPSTLYSRWRLCRSTIQIQNAVLRYIVVSGACGEELNLGYVRLMANGIWELACQHSPRCLTVIRIVLAIQSITIIIICKQNYLLCIPPDCGSHSPERIHTASSISNISKSQNVKSIKHPTRVLASVRDNKTGECNIKALVSSQVHIFDSYRWNMEFHLVIKKDKLNLHLHVSRIWL